MFKAALITLDLGGSPPYVSVHGDGHTSTARVVKVVTEGSSHDCYRLDVFEGSFSISSPRTAAIGMARLAFGGMFDISDSVEVKVSA